MWRSRTFWRLFGTHGVLLVASIGLLGIVVVGRVERYYLGQIEDSLHTKAVLVREIVCSRPSDQATSLQERVVALRQEVATRITLLGRDGEVLADSEEEPGHMENHANRPEVEAASEAGFGSSARYSTTLGMPMMYAALRTDDHGGPVAFVRVALPLANVSNQLAGLRRLVWTTAAATAVVALVLVFWMERRITRPLQELTAGAESIAAGEYGHKVYAGGRDEVGTLAQSFNRMSERLATQFTQLDEDRQQLRTILSGMVEGVVALDAEQRILFANERATQLLEFPTPNPVGRRLWEIVRQRGLLDVVQRALNQPEPSREELTWAGSATRSLTVHAARLPGAPTRGAVLVLHDTSELRRLERLRQDFVANVSHELKTPLSVIKACVETLLDGAMDDPPNRGPFLEQIADQSDRLYALILDMLSLTRIESGNEAFDFQAVPIGEAVHSCLERHRARAEARRQALTVEGSGGEKEAAWVDEEALGQILDNLVDNALKYTPEGGRVVVRWKADCDQVQLEVEDNGIGIPEPDLPRIFERFYRVDKARSREVGGTGLGLSIVKHLVQAMKGNVRAASRVGQGTTFIVRLPRAVSS